MSTLRLPVLPSGDSSTVDGNIILWFANVRPTDGIKHLSVEIVIVCWDYRNRRHVTKYVVMTFEGSVAASELAPGVMIPIRTTTNRPVALLRILGVLRRVPLIGRLVRKDALAA